MSNSWLSCDITVDRKATVARCAAASHAGAKPKSIAKTSYTWSKKVCVAKTPDGLAFALRSNSVHQKKARHGQRPVVHISGHQSPSHSTLTRLLTAFVKQRIIPLQRAVDDEVLSRSRGNFDGVVA